MSPKYSTKSRKICLVLALAVMAFLLAGELRCAWAARAKIPQRYSPKQNELWIKVDKANLKLTLRRGADEILKSYPIAVGRGKGVKKSRYDLITPAGVFTIWRVIQDATQLVYDPKWFGEPGEPQKGAYGSKLISFYNPWEIALHGTNSPKSIGRAVTHGCIRMSNKDIVELSKSVKPGMRLWIVERDEPAVEYDSI